MISFNRKVFQQDIHTNRIPTKQDSDAEDAHFSKECTDAYEMLSFLFLKSELIAFDN